MKSLLSARSCPGSIEPLEARIAPATFVTGIPNTLGNDIDYTDRTGPNQAQEDAVFINTGSSNDQISAAVGGGADTFYMRLSAGDKLQIFNTTNGVQDYLTMRSGQAIAFFVDKNGDNEVNEGELVSLSLGRDASVFLRAGLEGDIVTNLRGNGTLDMDSGEQPVKAARLVDGTKITSLAIVGGAVGGKILSGGSVSNVSVNGSVAAILTGTAADGATFDFFPGREGGEGIIAGQTATGRGPSISNVVVDAVGIIAAGNGGAGAAGGSIKSIQIIADRNGFVLQAGDGGAGDLSGGSGGSVRKIFVSGVPDDTANDQIIITAGAGGDASGQGVGGKGGGVGKVFVGFQVIGGRTVRDY
jgi:hypothetical protein